LNHPHSTTMTTATLSPADLSLVLGAVNAVRKLPSFNAAQPSNLSHGVRLLVTPDARGFAPLHHAVAGGNGALLEQLLKVLRRLRASFPTVDGRDRQGRTALHWAIERAQPSAIKALIDAGASPSAQDAQGRSALQLAIICASGAPSERLAFYHDMVRYLLQSGADVFASDMGGATCVHTAAATGDSELLSILVELGGAPANANDNTGENAIFYAVREGHLDLVPKLLSYGSDAFALNESQEDVLSYCRSLGDEKAAQQLEKMLQPAGDAMELSAPSSALGASNGGLFGSDAIAAPMWASNPVHLLR